MRNFSTQLDRQRTGRPVTTARPSPRIVETVTVTPLQREDRTTDRGKNPADWGWEDLRNYVVRQIETRFGDFPKDPLKLSGIFKGFVNRHGANAGPIAIAAFETFDGYWKGAPISVTRFCAGSDRYFADEIAERL